MIKIIQNSGLVSITLHFDEELRPVGHYCIVTSFIIYYPRHWNVCDISDFIKGLNTETLLIIEKAEGAAQSLTFLLYADKEKSPFLRI